MIPGWTRGSMNVKTGHAVVSTAEQKAKQHDSACGTSESPEKQEKKVAKPAKLTGCRPCSFPSATAGDRAKDGGAPSTAFKSRPHSYPSAHYRCTRRRPVSGPPTVHVPPRPLSSTRAGADLAMAKPYIMQPFSWVQRERTHEVVVAAVSVELLPRSC